MKRSTKFVLAAVAIIGVAGLAVPVIAQQAQHGGMMEDGMMGGHHGKMGGGMGKMGGGMGKMGGGMGKMGGGQSHAMAAFDTNEDGTLSPEEMTAGIQAELKTYDTDANGSLSLEEFEGMHEAHNRTMNDRRFQMHDADGDGQVTEAELTAMATNMQNHEGGHPGGGHMGRGMSGYN